MGAARHGLQPGAGTDPEASAGSFSFPPAPAPRISLPAREARSARRVVRGRRRRERLAEVAKGP
ncbi:MAG: hypothetical protein [Olavius algarvensis Gamma 1 endosymbiont]|nr:MAG: hypothetical protein [Olavius algarvensis Gamma 1 endosymbiont]